MIDLDHVRRLIAAEECRRDPDDSTWCITHEHYLPSCVDNCRDHPTDMVDALAEMADVIERVRQLPDSLDPSLLPDSFYSNDFRKGVREGWQSARAVIQGVLG